MDKLISQLYRFGVVGIISFIIDYLLLIFMVEVIGIYYMFSATVSFAVSTIFNYIFSMLWVFKIERLNKHRNFVIFILLSIIGLVINQVIMYVFVEKFKVYYIITKLIATAVVMIWNFTTKKIHLEKNEKRNNFG